MVCFHSSLCVIFLDTSKVKKKEEEGERSKRRSEEGKES